jgi:hypothetical protein
MIPTQTIPSLSGTFGIPTMLTLNPKMPKEPSSPSRSDTRIERQCIKNETNRLEINNSQPLTRGIKHWGLSGYANGISRIKVSCTLIEKCSVLPNDFIPPTVSGKQNKRHRKLKMK